MAPRMCAGPSPRLLFPCGTSVLTSGHKSAAHRRQCRHPSLRPPSPALKSPSAVRRPPSAVSTRGSQVTAITPAGHMSVWALQYLQAGVKANNNTLHHRMHQCVSIAQTRKSTICAPQNTCQIKCEWEIAKFFYGQKERKRCTKTKCFQTKKRVF